MNRIFNILSSCILLAVYALTPLYARADLSELLVQLGACVENCADSQTAVRITSLGRAPSGYSPVKYSYNDAGQVVFSAEVSGPGVGSGLNSLRIIRREANGTLTVLARPGVAVSGMPGATLRTGASVEIYDKYNALFEDGSVLLDAHITLPGSTVRGYVCLTGDAVIPLMLNGYSPPDVPGSSLILDPLPYPHLSKAGCSAAIRATANGNPELWEVQANQAPMLIGRPSSQAPGLPAGVTFGRDITPQSYRNYVRIEYMPQQSGYALVHSYLQGSGVRRDPAIDALPLNNEALWLRSPSGAMSLVMRSGEPVPGLPGLYFGQLATRLYRPTVATTPGYIVMQGGSVTANGKYAFRAELTDASGDYNSTAIWSNRSGALRPEIKTGDRFTDALSGQEWQISVIGLVGQYQPGIHLHDNGTLYYSGSGYRVGIDPLGATNPSRRVIIEHLIDGTKRVIAFEGQAAPGRPDLIFGNSVATNFFMTQRPSVIFSSNVSSSYEHAVLTYRDGQLRVSARVREPIASLNGASLQDLQPLLIPASSRGNFTWNITDIFNPLLALGDDMGNLRLLVDAQGHFPSSTDATLNGVKNICSSYGFNASGNLLLQCNGGGNLIRLVAYYPDDLGGGRCVADFNSDGSATVQDIFSFLTLWFALDTHADFNRDGGVTVQDLFDFLNAWFEGCL